MSATPKNEFNDATLNQNTVQTANFGSEDEQKFSISDVSVRLNNAIHDGTTNQNSLQTPDFASTDKGQFGVSDIEDGCQIKEEPISCDEMLGKEQIAALLDDDTMSGYSDNDMPPLIRLESTALGQPPDSTALGRTPESTALGRTPESTALDQIPESTTLSQNPESVPNPAIFADHIRKRTVVGPIIMNEHARRKRHKKIFPTGKLTKSTIKHAKKEESFGYDRHDNVTDLGRTADDAPVDKKRLRNDKRNKKRRVERKRKRILKQQMEDEEKERKSLRRCQAAQKRKEQNGNEDDDLGYEDNLDDLSSVDETEEQHISKAKLRKLHEFYRLSDNPRLKVQWERYHMQKKEDKELDPKHVIIPYTTWSDSSVMRQLLDDACKVCYSIHSGEFRTCPFLSPLATVPNNPQSKYGHELPPMIHLNESRIYADRKSLFAHNKIQQQTLFGPLKGNIISGESLSAVRIGNLDINHFWPIKTVQTHSHDNLTIEEYLDTSDAEASNWLRFIVPEHSNDLIDRDANTFNMQRILKDGEIYFVSTRDISQGEELILRCLEPPEKIYFKLIPLYKFWFSERIAIKQLLHECVRCESYKPVTFDNLTTLIRHHHVFHTFTPGMFKMALIFQCSVCGLDFDSSKKLTAHRTDQHSDVITAGRDLRCNLCFTTDLNCHTLSAVKKHMNKYHGFNIEYLCPKCGKKFSCYNAMYGHIARVHCEDDLSVRTCKICNAVLKSKRQLYDHMKIVHENRRPVKCDKCGHGFPDGHQLGIHSLTHTGLKPFECDIEGCTTAYTTKQCLQKHYKSKHGFTDFNMPQIERKFLFTDDRNISSTNSNIQ